MASVLLQDIIVGSPSHESVRRTFVCRNGHQYKSDKPVTITAYGLTPAFSICPACFVTMVVELCACEELKPPTPPQPVMPDIHPPSANLAHIGPLPAHTPKPMTMAELMAARRRAQGLTDVPAPIPVAQKPVPVPGETANLAPEGVEPPTEGEDMPDVEELDNE